MIANPLVAKHLFYIAHLQFGALVFASLFSQIPFLRQNKHNKTLRPSWALKLHVYVVLRLARRYQDTIKNNNLVCTTLC